MKPLVGEADNPAKGLEMLSDALRGYPNPLRLHVRLVSGEKDDISHNAYLCFSRSNAGEFASLRVTGRRVGTRRTPCRAAR